MSSTDNKSHEIPNWAIENMAKESRLHDELVVTREAYNQAVKFMVSHAKGDTSGSVAAALVLLSLYNGSKWHMNLTDLCNMDYELLQSTLIAIRGRVLLHEEPHTVIDNGKEIFIALEKQWQHLNTHHRYKEN